MGGPALTQATLNAAERIDGRLNALLGAADRAEARSALLRLFESLDFSLDSGVVPLKGEDLPTSAERIAVRDQVHVLLLVMPEKGRPLMRLVRTALKEIDSALAGEKLLVAGSVESGEWQIIWPSIAGEKQVIRRIALHRGQPHRTVATQLADVYENALRTDIHQALEKAYDVTAVTKKFYEEYERIFNWAMANVTGIAKEGDRRLFCQRLFNRLMFIYFLQRKGWLTFDGRADYLNALWNDYKARPDEAGFYDSRLKNLFFMGLNNERSADFSEARAAMEKIIGKVPFLNGGLFDKAATDLMSGVSVPDGLFPTLLNDLFERYNFTIDESTPYDVQVAVDPEMLGKVFEKLVTGRHESGSYYTPREIVSFMCREALKGYLQTQVPELPEDVIENYVEHHDVSGIDRGRAGQVLEALERVTVVDPACGSGAYLLGMMQELIDLQTILFNPELLASPRSLFETKLDIIGRNLYGVDVDEFAVNIAMLRLWLALVVEYDAPGDPPPLPNLDFKIVRGDSVGGPSPEATQLGLMTQAIRTNLIERRGEYLRAFGDEKTGLRREIDTLTTELASEMAHGEQYQNAVDWLVEFPEVFASGGFDVVVANPPYVRQESITALKPQLKSVYGTLYSGTADLYVYFYYRALQVLRPGGMLVFISSNKWFKAAYGEKLRQRMATVASIWSVTDFEDRPVFEAAAYAMIFVAELKDGEAEQPTTFTQVKSLAPPYPDVSALINALGRTLPKGAIVGSEWRLTDADSLRRLDRMRQGTIPLSEYVGGKIYYGIKTGLNHAFVIDRATRSALIAASDRLLDLLVNFLARQDVGIGVVALAVKGAEIADGRTDVGVVDVAVDVVGAVRLRMQAAAHGVGGAAQGGQIVAIEQGDAFACRSAARRQQLFASVRNGSIQGSLLAGPAPARRPACSNGAVRPARGPRSKAGCWRDSGDKNRRPVPDAVLRVRDRAGTIQSAPLGAVQRRLHAARSTPSAPPTRRRRTASPSSRTTPGRDRRRS